MCLLTLVAVVLSALLTALVYYASFDSRMKSEVRQETQLVQSAVELSGETYLESVTNTPNRITLIDTDGTVLFDNQADPATMENHSGREEVKRAFSSGAGEATRMSGTLSQQTFYYAVKLSDGQVLRVAAETDSVFAALLSVLPWILGVAVVVTVITVLFSRVLTKKIVAPINSLDLDHPADNVVYDELSQLLGRINRQNQIIDQQIRSLRESRRNLPPLPKT